MNKKDLHSGKADMSATPELQRFIGDLFASTYPVATNTLADLRGLLLGNELFLSNEGELVGRLDRTSLVIEVDTLIDRRGIETKLSRLLVN